MSRWVIHCFILLLLASCQMEQAGVISGVNLILDTSHGGGSSAWGLAKCESCHALAVIHEDADGVAPLVRRHGYATCTGCHGDNGTGQVRRCTICHNTSDLPRLPLSGGLYSHGFASAKAAPLQDAQCLVCHPAADMDGRFELERDLASLPDAAGHPAPYRTVSDFCLRCHNRDHQQPGFEMQEKRFDDPLIAIEDAWRHVDKHGPSAGSGERTYAGLRSGYRYRSEVECTDCHAMHGTGNGKLIIDSSSKGVSRLDDTLREKPYRVEVTDGDYSQLCVLCHAMETVLDAGGEDTGNGLSGVHERGSDCRPCHTHGEAVQAGL